MPIYEFFCKNCGVFEQMINIHSDNKKVNCPNCNNSNTKRIFSPPSYSGVFSGVRHKARQRAEKARIPQVVRKQVGQPLDGTLPMPHNHDHCHDHCGGDPGYPPWMIKH